MADGRGDRVAMVRRDTPDFARLIDGSAHNPKWADLPLEELRALLSRKITAYLAAELATFEKEVLRGECLWLRYLLGRITVEGVLLPDFSDPEAFFR
jgi:hypothetical protein